MKMKNKNTEQNADRKKHKEALKLGRRSEPILERNAPTRIERQTFLIVCEGENTEPSYFKQFRLSTATIKPSWRGVQYHFLGKSRDSTIAGKKLRSSVVCFRQR
jgi:hypothetical protein